MKLEQLNLHLGHWPIPIATSQKLECVVCCIKQAKLHLTRDLWHKSRIKCLHYGVHLCNEEEERQCYTKYHTNIQYVIVVLCFSRRSHSRSPPRHKRSRRSLTTKTMYLHRPINIYYLYICIYLFMHQLIELINKVWHYASAIKVGHFEWIPMQAWQRGKLLPNQYYYLKNRQ